MIYFEVISKKFTISLSLELFDATNIPCDKNTFDYVFSVSVIEHIDVKLLMKLIGY